MTLADAATSVGFSSGLVTVLVALIGSAGVIGAALVSQVFGKKTEVPKVAPGDDGPLYQRIGRLEAELEDCKEDLKTERAK